MKPAGAANGGAGQNLLTNTNSSTLPPTNPSGLPMQSVMVESIFRSTALPVVQEQFVKAVMGEEFPYFMSVPGTQQTVSPIVDASNGTEVTIKNVRIEGNKNIFTNNSGKEVIWTDQTPKDIDTIIKRRLNSSDSGDLLEGKAAQAVNEVTEVKGVGLKLSDTSKSPLGDLDVVTDYYIIEVKSSLGAVKEKQIPKYTDPSDPNYVNAHNRKVIYFIEDDVPKALKEIQKLKVLEL